MQGQAGAQTQQVVGVVGRSGSGKTTLLVYLIGQLAGRGLKVNIVKHSHHDISLEPPGKDSARLRMAGAAEVMVASPFRFSIAHELRGAPEPTLAEQLARLAPADLTLVEGFKTDSIDKLEVYRSALGQAPLFPADSGIIAVASDLPAPADLRAGVRWLNLNQPELVLDWLLARLPN